MGLLFDSVQPIEEPVLKKGSTNMEVFETLKTCDPLSRLSLFDSIGEDIFFILQMT